MLIVTVTLVPGGFAPLRRDLGILRISNLTDLAPISDYRVDVVEASNPLTEMPGRIGSCRIEDHDRHQSVWVLVERAAAAAQNADLVEF
jgi:hypothetical protein